MTIEITGPSSNEIDQIIRELQKGAKDEVHRILTAVGAGAVAVISKGYEKLVYSTPPGVFGRPKDAAKPLAQAVQMETEDDGVTVFTAKPEAVYVEFGTGIFSTVGPGGPVRPKSKRFLAFPVWNIPPDFLGAFLPREMAEGDLPFGAIGLVFAKEVAGMKARPVWTNPATEKAIEKILELEIKNSEIFQ